QAKADRAPGFRPCLIIVLARQPVASNCTASVRLQRLRLACRSGARLIPILATRPSWPCMSLDRYTQSTLNVARHAKKTEVESEIQSQIEYQEVQEGQASSAAQAAEGCCQHSSA